MDLMTDFLAGYVGSFVFAEITAATSDVGRRNGQRYGIRVVPG